MACKIFKQPTDNVTKSFLCLSLLFATLLQWGAAQTATKEKDRIVLAVTISEEEGKNKVSCKLTNHSEFPICTSGVVYRVFYAKLTDEAGNELPQEQAWAKKFSQKSSRRYIRQHSHVFFDVKPGASDKFDFLLQNAYPASSLEKGVKLEISWESFYYGASNDLDGNPYQFPPEWITSVAFSLEKLPTGLVAVPVDDLPAQPAPVANVKPAPVANVKPEPPSNGNLWLWLVPALVLVTTLVALLRGGRGGNAGGSRQG